MKATQLFWVGAALLGACSSNTSQGRLGDAQAVPAISIREIVSSEAWVGRRVVVTGRCLGYAASVAVGGPPVTRSDWQLEEDELAIFVSGSLPVGCSATGGSEGQTTITAVVQQDTLRMGDLSGTTRRYLVRVGASADE